MQINNAALTFALLIFHQSCDGFVATSPQIQRPSLTQPSFGIKPLSRRAPSSHLYGTDAVMGRTTANNNEVERLRSMAAQLRAEAASLSAEQTQRISDETQKLFAKFDRNQDGAISLEELQLGLKVALGVEVPPRRAQQLLETLDSNGDGALQPDEFRPVNQLGSRLDAIVRDERTAALEFAEIARREEEAARIAEMRTAVLNEAAPTNTDKVLSVTPYLLPLLDSLQYANMFVTNHQDNPVAQAITVLYTLYSSIPLGSLISFLALSFLSSNPSLNRLVRFNMEQAVALDVALFVPGLLLGAAGFVASSTGVQIPSEALELTSDGVLVAMLASIAYAATSSLLGATPNKLPGVSQYVEDRMITPDMFDDEGRFVGPKPGDDEGPKL